MATLTSTVPGAIQQLLTYIEGVATANPSLEISTSIGLPIARVANNYIMVGNYETGELIDNYHQDWAGLPAGAVRKNEEYDILCSLRAWSGESDPVSRLNDAYTMFDGVMGFVMTNPGANGTITASGSWQVTDVKMPESGPFDAKGWGVIMTFAVSVRNVRLTQ